MTHEEYFAKTTLPTLCLDLRMARNGSADPWSDTEVQEALAWLQHRLDTWKPSRPAGNKFDECVRQLVIATIEEVEAR